MKIAAIIPSRYNSSRFKGKPLVKIKGITMVERVYRQVEKADKFPEIIVATDDTRISNVVFRFGGNCMLTSGAHNSGTERLWEVLEKSEYDAVVNIQGDEPLVPERLIADIYDELNKGVHPVVTAAYYNNSLEDFLSENVVKVVFDKNHRALYFSRSPVPFSINSKFEGFFQHIGIYGYTKSAIRDFIQYPGSKLERTEKLEQLRFLENGIPIKVILSSEKSFGVDVPDDIIKIEEILGN